MLAQQVRMDHRSELLAQYELYPFHQHPLWIAIQNGTLSYQQVIRAEVQHCIRTREGRKLRENAVQQAKRLNENLFRHLLDTYLEECTNDASGPSHQELIERLVQMGGVSQAEIDVTPPTAGNAAAIALYRDIAERGAGCHMVGAGAVEFFYSDLSPKIFKAYTKHYGMTEEQAFTYKLHGPMDQEHANRAFEVLEDVLQLHGWTTVLASVRDAFIATSLHYDGMLQAATGLGAYWDGRS